ncbi:sulfite exporter TauE/SafE family protein [Helicobacter heilmannii]|uniref:Probable membrane transporter protein n=1 Tax=Helicobacter heilmannii TaxID=35817 RepID=A0A0K2XU48_HELHE|nr:sulfite exporter TauE/SafE family protein [Helicobacter heilmannii]CCM11440.1 membrane protein [Helicobacter heilmannii ASB1.4]CRF45396.1 membrane protein, putative [Helicobacter heilmannii]CRF47589.1 membrane protein, putative [Helicobacter heilmannii]CRF49064.1 membrane protein, putative [Helicobacter heilmannii]CRF51007.1 membrane protein, putative [Helicobacter heilmannii]
MALDFVLAFVGFVTGITAGFFGIGGGEIVVPAAVFAGFSYSHAVGISLFQMLFSSLVGSLINYKKGLLDIKEGLAIAGGGLFGAMLGSFLLKRMDDRILMGLFVAVVCYTFFKYAFIKKGNYPRAHFRLHAHNAHFKIPLIRWNLSKKHAILALAGLITGIFSIPLGMGGGILIVPFLGYFLKYDTQKIVPLGLFFVIFSSLSGVIALTHAGVLAPRILWVGFLVGVGALAGVGLGIKLILIATEKIHRVLLLSIYALSIVATGYKLVTEL